MFDMVIQLFPVWMILPIRGAWNRTCKPPSLRWFDGLKYNSRWNVRSTTDGSHPMLCSDSRCCRCMRNPLKQSHSVKWFQKMLQKFSPIPVGKFSSIMSHSSVVLFLHVFTTFDWVHRFGNHWAAHCHGWIWHRCPFASSLQGVCMEASWTVGHGWSCLSKA